MKIFINGSHAITETNVAWALPYWTERQRRQREGVRITWEFV